MKWLSYTGKIFNCKFSQKVACVSRYTTVCDLHDDVLEQEVMVKYSLTQGIKELR